MQTQIRRMELVRAIPDPLWSLYRSARGVVGKLRRTTGNLLFPHVVEKLRRTGAPSDNEKLWKLATRGFYGLIYPFQNRTEFLGLLGVLRRARPRVMMEIGTALGGTLFMFMRVAADDARAVSVDLPGGGGGGGYRVERIPLYKALALPLQQVELIRDDSHDPLVLRRVQDWLAGDQLDFLMIDGDHSYEGVKQDYEFYSPLVRPGGLIAFHDIVSVSGVEQFWGELKVGRRVDEFIGSEGCARLEGRVCGIGVLHV